ncbi:hypothetical protein PGTUg99_009576 [Puccinia graminis f. sp. tritici]|uniref:Uncharacterized protein n=1 Tax=Puccinia graminis f. sp. tritici TaxID=56615 RepID=A0A5B0SK12_PUCGR|nr:hypothetical protein PGTUg99_009576 [Puccinia graminis f. sp. tritici]
MAYRFNSKKAGFFALLTYAHHIIHSTEGGEIHSIDGVLTPPHRIPCLWSNLSSKTWKTVDEAISKIGPGGEAEVKSYSHGYSTLRILGERPWNDKYVSYPATQIDSYRFPTDESRYLPGKIILFDSEVVPGHLVPEEPGGPETPRYLVPNSIQAPRVHQAPPRVPKTGTSALRANAEPFTPGQANRQKVTLPDKKTYREIVASGIMPQDEPAGDRESTNPNEMSGHALSKGVSSAIGEQPVAQNLRNVTQNRKMRKNLPKEASVAHPMNFYRNQPRKQIEPDRNFLAKKLDAKSPVGRILNRARNEPGTESITDSSSVKETDRVMPLQTSRTKKVDTKSPAIQILTRAKDEPKQAKIESIPNSVSVQKTEASKEDEKQEDISDHARNSISQEVPIDRQKSADDKNPNMQHIERHETILTSALDQGGVGKIAEAEKADFMNPKNGSESLERPESTLKTPQASQKNDEKKLASSNMALDDVQKVSSNEVIQDEKKMTMPLESNNKREQNSLEDKPGTPSPAGVDHDESLSRQAVTEASQSAVGNLNYKSALLKKVLIPNIGQKKVQLENNIEQINPDTNKLKSDISKIHQRKTGAQNNHRTNPISKHFEWYGPALITNKPGLNSSFKMKPAPNARPLGLKKHQRLKQIETTLREKIAKVDHAAIGADMTIQNPIVETVPKSEEIIYDSQSPTQESYLSVLKKHQNLQTSQPEKHLSQDDAPIGTDVGKEGPVVETMPTVTKLTTDPDQFGNNENQELWETIPIHSKV